jgi:hypothetical protein
MLYFVKQICGQIVPAPGILAAIISIVVKSKRRWLSQLRNQMKRNLYIANVLLMATFFLVILGMRNTSLDHDRGPKQRPRAVVESVSKAPLAAVAIGGELNQLDAMACPVFAVAALSEERTFLTQVISHTPALAQRFIPSRASPAAPLSRLS